jgi:hypothetical protein
MIQLIVPVDACITFLPGLRRSSWEAVWIDRTSNSADTPLRLRLGACTISLFADHDNIPSSMPSWRLHSVPQRRLVHTKLPYPSCFCPLWQKLWKALRSDHGTVRLLRWCKGQLQIREPGVQCRASEHTTWMAPSVMSVHHIDHEKAVVGVGVCLTRASGGDVCAYPSRPVFASEKSERWSARLTSFPDDDISPRSGGRHSRSRGILRRTGRGNRERGPGGTHTLPTVLSFFFFFLDE